MITVFLCDDESETLEYYATLLQDFCDQQNILISISTFRSSDELFFMLDDSEILPDIIYLDIQMPGDNGLMIAKKLRSMNVQSEIIFLSNDRDRVFDSFSVTPTNYLLKFDLTPQRFIDVFQDAMVKAKSKRSQLLVYKIKGLSYTIAIADILSMEIRNRIIIMHTRDLNTIKYYGTMKEIESQIKKTPLIRVQRSFIINMTYIKALGKNEVTLIDGSVIPIGNKYIKALENQFIEFMNR